MLLALNNATVVTAHQAAIYDKAAIKNALGRATTFTLINILFFLLYQLYSSVIVIRKSV